MAGGVPSGNVPAISTISEKVLLSHIRRDCVDTVLVFKQAADPLTPRTRHGLVWRRFQRGKKHMNYKALALGATIGFMAALSPACGPTDECNTCTDNTGACVATVNDQNCGSDGNACVACPTGQVCQAGSCVATGQPDAGDGGVVTGCNATNCATGCCTAAGTCVSGTFASNCGQGGAACDQCGMGEQCSVPTGQSTRQCHVPTAVDAGPQVGISCETTADCAAISADAVCKTGADDGEFQFLAGMCTIDCSAGQTCPTGSECIVNAIDVGGMPRELFGLNNAVCLANCVPGDWSSNTDTNTCADGMFCLPLSQTEGVCVPVTPPPAAVLGQDCTTNADNCSFPPSHGTCVTGFTPGDKGICSADCTFNGECGTGGVCLGFNNRGVGLCLKSCTEPQTGRGGCPTDLTCFGLTGADGGALPEGACFPDCVVDPCGADAGTCNPASGHCE